MASIAAIMTTREKNFTGTPPCWFLLAEQKCELCTPTGGEEDKRYLLHLGSINSHASQLLGGSACASLMPVVITPA